MFGVIVAVFAGVLLALHGITVDEPLFWAILVPVCLIGAVISAALR